MEPLTQPLLCKYCRRERTPGKAKSMNKHPHLKCSYFTVIIMFLEKKEKKKKSHYAGSNATYGKNSEEIITFTRSKTTAI